MKDCDQFREVFESDALGRLDPGERAALEAHLATGCKDCAKTVEEAQAARRSGPSEAAIPVWICAGVAALFVATIYSAWNAQRLEREIQRADQTAAAILEHRHELETQLEEAKREAAILTDPSSVKITLASSDPQIPQLEARWHSQLGIVLTGQKIPVPPGNRVLQLWLIPKAPGGRPIPSRTLRPDADGKFVLLVLNPPELLAETKALAITEEPAGGSPQPTTTSRWTGGVT